MVVGVEADRAAVLAVDLPGAVCHRECLAPPEHGNEHVDAVVGEFLPLAVHVIQHAVAYGVEDGPVQVVQDHLRELHRQDGKYPDNQQKSFHLTASCMYRPVC